MANPAEAFRDAIKAAGLIPPVAVEADGKLRRFPSNGKRGDDSGWYVLHPDGIPAGSFGDWRSGVSQTWRADIGRKLSPPEEAAYRLKIDAQRRAREAEEADRRERARLQADEIWKRSGPVESHGYLTSKGINPSGARLYRGPLIISGLRCDGCLVVPLRDTEGQIWTLEFISPNGEKRFLPNGDKRGHYYPIGKPADKIIICEGYATGASLHEVTGEGVANAMDASNLLPVARALRSKYPHTTLIIAADNDQWTEGNPGITKAKEAAQMANAGVVWPQFKDAEGKPTDFNDLHQREGLEAVKAAMDGATAVKQDPKENASGISYRRMSDIQAQPVRWLWPGRIARGKVSMIAGHPGLGKSQITASLAAIVSKGSLWPVDRTRAEAGNVIFLSAEDDAEDTIRPRLEAAGADLSRIYMVDAVRDERAGETIQRGFNLKADLSRLGAMCAEIGNVALIVIDPITAYMGGVETHYNADVRAALAPVSDMAAKHGAAVVCVSHLNKGGGNGSDALMRVTGSIAFVAAARAAFLVCKDDETDGRRLFLPLKNNLGSDESGLAFELQKHRLESDIDTCRVAWEGQAVTVTADQALASQNGGDRSEIEEAKAFLLRELEYGRVPTNEIERNAEGNGISRATLRRAKQALGVKAVKEGKPGDPSAPGKWYWKMPDTPPKMLKSAEDAQENNVSTFGGNERLRGEQEADDAGGVVV